MAFGFPASYTATVSTVGSHNDTHASIIGVFDSLGWKYRALDPNRYEVLLPISGASWGERLKVELTGEGTIIATSRCIFPFQLFDWGKNKQNVEEFILRFSPREIREARLGLNEPAYLSESGQTPIERLITDNYIESAEKKSANGDVT